MSEVTTELQVVQPAIVIPAVSTEEALKVWKSYQDLKASIVDASVDIQLIQGKQFLKKSYWRKIATFFNLSVEVVAEEHEVIGDTVVYSFTCKATATNGRFAIGTGSCDSYEKATLVDGKYKTYDKYKKTYVDATPNSLHNVRSTAETRAFNRAISNLVGGGEVSADEIVDRHEPEEVKAPIQEAVTVEQAPQEADPFAGIPSFIKQEAEEKKHHRPPTGGICPMCGKPTKVNTTKTNKKVEVCSSRTYDVATRTTSGCAFEKWINE